MKYYSKDYLDLLPGFFSAALKKHPVIEKNFESVNLKPFRKKISRNDITNDDTSINDWFYDINLEDSDPKRLVSTLWLCSLMRQLTHNVSPAGNIKQPITDPSNRVIYGKGTPEKEVMREIMSLIKQQDKWLQKKIKETYLPRIKSLKYAKNLKVVFSTDPWDIATISMRGISSCMSWDSDMCRSLVGTVFDPYAAVIYITDETKAVDRKSRGYVYEMGEKMLYRSVVRVVKRVATSEEKIGIECAYPTKTKNGEWDSDETARRTFINAIVSASGDPLKTIFLTRGIGGYLIKHSDLAAGVRNMHTAYRSYSDAGLYYEEAPKPSRRASH